MQALHFLHSSLVDILDLERPAGGAGGGAREEDEGWTSRSSLRRTAGRA
jgi:hypothetical protein